MTYTRFSTIGKVVLLHQIWENEFRVKLKGFVKYDKSKIQTVWAHFQQELNEL
jgi:hypothetical protein